MLSMPGLLLILVGWIYQLYYSMMSDKEIKVLFLVSYALGVICLIWDGFYLGNATEAWLNLAILIPVSLISIKNMS